MQAQPLSPQGFRQLRTSLQRPSEATAEPVGLPQPCYSAPQGRLPAQRGLDLTLPCHDAPQVQPLSPQGLGLPPLERGLEGPRNAELGTTSLASADPSDPESSAESGDAVFTPEQHIAHAMTQTTRAPPLPDLSAECEENTSAIVEDAAGVAAMRKAQLE